jgi:hypothetical protein
MHMLDTGERPMGLHALRQAEIDNPQGEAVGLRSHIRRTLRSWHSASHPDSIFIWIPKNAGTSVFTALHAHGMIKLKSPENVARYFRNSGRVTFGHMAVKPLVADGLVSPQFIRSAFKFAIVRNPYARAVSLYRYLLGPLLSNWREPPSFADFLGILADGRYDKIGPYNSRGLSQCNPQSEWLRDLAPDAIYKVEEMDGLATDLSERWSIPKPNLPHANRSGGSIDLSRDEKAMVERIYAEDFEAFGY